MELREVHLEREAAGRTRIAEVPGTERTRPVDLLVLAMGFVGPEAEQLMAQLGTRLDARGNVRVDARFRTSTEGVWAVGDAQRGASLIVWAISDGREAAREVDSVLTGRPSRLPTRGTHLPFNGSR
jgi:glutamate synthase (NADPH/NADH) small chain